MGFESVIGHEGVVEHLKKAVSSGHVSHAYIFAGEEGSGKKLLANLFAQALLCREREPGTAERVPCGTCISCIQAQSGTNPDLIVLSHEKDNLISVDEIREGVVGPVQIRPYQGGYRVFLIDEAEKMNAAAQNALLKTIEEPPSYAVILLLTANPDALLPTILSRCVILHLRAVEERKIRDFLIREKGADPETAGTAAAFSQGNTGTAIALATESGQAEELAFETDLFSEMPRADYGRILSDVKRLAEKKGGADRFLDRMLMWLRDVMLVKSGAGDMQILFRGAKEALTEQAALYSWERLARIADAVGTVRTRLRANVNFEMTMELLFLSVRV